MLSYNVLTFKLIGGKKSRCEPGFTITKLTTDKNFLTLLFFFFFSGEGSNRMSLVLYDPHSELALRGFYLQVRCGRCWGWFCTHLWLPLYTFMNISCLRYSSNYSSVEQQSRDEVVAQAQCGNAASRKAVV